METERGPGAGLRQRIFEVLEHGRRREPASRAADWLLVLLVLADVAATVAYTVPDIAASQGAALQLLDRICVSVFAVEYVGRIWTAPEHPLLRGCSLRDCALPPPR